MEKHNIIHKRGIIMTKKRFMGLFQGDMLVSVKDTQTNERVNIIQIITLANILYEENKHLKQEIQNLNCELELLKNSLDMRKGKKAKWNG